MEWIKIMVLLNLKNKRKERGRETETEGSIVIRIGPMKYVLFVSINFFK